LLTSEAKNELRNFISLLPDPGSLLESNLELAVEGHCARYGTEEGRAELSRERASNTYNYLLSIWNGEASAEVRGAGASKPVTVDREKQYLNRRVYLELKGTIIKDFTEN
jgi:outer membrane protein OmpA-like peptidoglycan-associated protein